MPICVKCKREIADEYQFCPFCGRSQTVPAQKKGKKQRGNGQGSVYKRGKTWTAVVTTGYDLSPDGNLIHRTHSKGGFRTKLEAVEYIPILKERKETSTAYTLKGLYDKWISTHNAGKSTISCYNAAMNYFKPLWDKPVSDITVDDLQACVDDCPRRRQTKSNMKAVCGLIYKYGIPRGYVPSKLNLAEYVKVNGEPPIAKEGLPLAALKLIERNIGKVPYADYVYCQCYLGFRPSELLDLQIKDYNAIDHCFVGGAKTKAGKNRTVTISPKIQPQIDTIIGGRDKGYVFGINGAKMTAKQYRDAFYEVLDECGIDNPVMEMDGRKRYKYTPHSCRHTFATLMKRAPGADKDKLRLIGHADTAMLRHYQDVELTDLKRITDQL